MSVKEEFEKKVKRVYDLTTKAVDIANITFFLDEDDDDLLSVERISDAETKFKFFPDGDEYFVKDGVINAI